jgi:hypothetical protein
MRFGGVKRAVRRPTVGLTWEHCQVVRCVTTKGSPGAWFWVTLSLGSCMSKSIKFIVACGCLAAAVVAAAACSPRRIPPLTVTDLMEDRVALDGVLLKCNADPVKARTDSDCMNARIAVERLASRVDPAEEAKRAEDFERSREKLRVSEDKKREEQASKTKVDAYSLPLVPVESAPPPKDPPQPVVGQAKP